MQVSNLLLLDQLPVYWSLPLPVSVQAQQDEVWGRRWALTDACWVSMEVWLVPLVQASTYSEKSAK